MSDESPPTRRQQAIDELFRQRGPSREDALIGEIVRFLVRADKTALARIYAQVREQEAAMDEQHRQRWHERFGGERTDESDEPR